jgi:Holliday junction resolvase RusA-like endonuclease
MCATSAMAREGLALFDGPVRVHVKFVLPRAKTRRRLFACVKPDLDKLLRALFDGLEGSVFTNDSRVIAIYARKYYQEDALEMGAYVEVQSVDAVVNCKSALEELDEACGWYTDRRERPL